MPRIIGLSLSALFLFMALFKAWREQKSQRDAALEQVSALQQRLDAMSKSNIRGVIDWGVVGSQPNNRAHIGVIVSLTNSGAASAIDHGSWMLSARAPNGKVYRGEPNTLLDKNLDFCFPPATVRRFVLEDALYLKAASPLPMNSTTQGFIWFGFSVPKATIFLLDTILTLEATSVTGQSIKIDTTIRDLSDKMSHTKLFIGIKNPRELHIPCNENAPY